MTARRQVERRSGGPDPIATRRLLRSGALAGPLFVATFVIEGRHRTDYDPCRHPVSSLALGPGGWRQTLNFLLAGALYTSGAVGLARPYAVSESDGTNPGKAGPLLIGAAALGLLGAAAFTTDPVSGYPPGTSDTPAAYSTSGAMHDLLSVPTFLGIPAAALVYAWQFARGGKPGWAAYSAVTGLSMPIATVAASVAFSQAPSLVAHGGRLQRTAVTIGFTWLTALCLRTLRNR
jgi:Protein of unknown function (DUF998)